MNAAKFNTVVLILIYAFNLPCLVKAQAPTSEMIAVGQLNLMPMPASVQMQAGRLPITSSFNVMVKNYADDRLRGGIARMRTRLAGRTVLSFPASERPRERAQVLHSGLTQ